MLAIFTAIQNNLCSFVISLYPLKYVKFSFRINVHLVKKNTKKHAKLILLNQKVKDTKVQTSGVNDFDLSTYDRQIDRHTYKNAHIYTHTHKRLLIYYYIRYMADEYMYMQINR